MTSNIFSYWILRKIVFILFFLISCNVQSSIVLLNSSYDTGRELFISINSSFIEFWKKNHPHDHVVIHQSHAASTRQAMTVLQGLPADVVTYNQVTDIEILCEKGKLVSSDWKLRLPNNSSPFYSTIAFVVRKDNPKKIYDWYDLVSENVKIILPNPKTSGNGRYIYLAAWNFFAQLNDFNIIKVRYLMSKLLHNVLVFDIGSRGAAASFIDREQGDVLITFESEANVICHQCSMYNYEIIIPKKNILAEFPVAWIDINIRKHGTEKIAKAYLQYLYTQEAQRIIANFYYRVNIISIMKEYHNQFPDVELFRVEDQFSDWHTLMYTHFNKGGELDKLLEKRYNN